MIGSNLLSIATGFAPHAHCPDRVEDADFPGKDVAETLIPEGMERITLRHHRGAFVGCFSLRLWKNIRWDLFKRWKVDRNPRITDRMARDFLPFIRNHYDLITTAPPSASRSPARYCTHDLATAISRMTHIPFAPAFSQKTDKPYHGRHSSLSQSEPTLLPSWNVRNRSILFVDDCITTGAPSRHRRDYEALVRMGNHVDGLIWVSAGGYCLESPCISIMAKVF